MAFRVSVFDLCTGMGLSGVLVTLTGPVTFQQTTDATGILDFTVNLGPPGTYTITATRAGYEKYSPSGDPTVVLSGSAPFIVPDRDNQTFFLVPEEGCEGGDANNCLTIQVYDDCTNSALREWDIEVTWPGGSDSEVGFGGSAFGVCGIPEGVEVCWTVSKSGYTQVGGEQCVIKTAGTTQVVETRLSPTGGCPGDDDGDDEGACHPHLGHPDCLVAADTVPDLTTSLPATSMRRPQLVACGAEWFDPNDAAHSDANTTRIVLARPVPAGATLVVALASAGCHFPWEDTGRGYQAQGLLTDQYGNIYRQDLKYVLDAGVDPWESEPCGAADAHFIIWVCEGVHGPGPGTGLAAGDELTLSHELMIESATFSVDLFGNTSFPVPVTSWRFRTGFSRYHYLPFPTSGLVSSLEDGSLPEWYTSPDILGGLPDDGRFDVTAYGFECPFDPDPPGFVYSAGTYLNSNASRCVQWHYRKEGEIIRAPRAYLAFYIEGASGWMNMGGGETYPSYSETNQSSQNQTRANALTGLCGGYGVADRCFSYINPIHRTHVETWAACDEPPDCKQLCILGFFVARRTICGDFPGFAPRPGIAEIGVSEMDDVQIRAYYRVQEIDNILPGTCPPIFTYPNVGFAGELSAAGRWSLASLVLTDDRAFDCSACEEDREECPPGQTWHPVYGCVGDDDGGGGDDDDGGGGVGSGETCETAEGIADSASSCAPQLGLGIG